MSFSRSITRFLALAATGVAIAAAGASAASASTCTTTVPGTGSVTVWHAPVDLRPYGAQTGGISPITGYEQNGYGMESAWVDANQDTIYPDCPGSVAPVGPQQNLGTVTGDLLQSDQGSQLTDTFETTNDAFGCR
jgi:hypothetical protein